MRRNSYALAALAAAAVPGLDPARTVLVATPIDELDVAGVIGDGGRRVLVTAPTTPAAGAHLEKDVHVTDALASTSLAPLVSPSIGFVRLPEGGRAVVSEPPRGTPLLFATLTADPDAARSLGRVLARIHSVPAYVAESAGAETFSAQAVRAAHRSQLARARAATGLPASVAQRWDTILADDELWSFRPCFIHGGLSEESLFAEGHEITGVVGWQDARTGDPATDLAWLVSALDPETFDVLFEAYSRELPVAPHARLVERAQAVGELAVVDWLMHGLEAEDETIVEDARGMLEDLESDLAQLAREEAEREYDALRPVAAHDADQGSDTLRHEPRTPVVRPADDVSTAARPDETPGAPARAGAAAPRDDAPRTPPSDGTEGGSHAAGLGEAETLDEHRRLGR